MNNSNKASRRAIFLSILLATIGYQTTKFGDVKVNYTDENYEITEPTKDDITIKRIDIDGKEYSLEDENNDNVVDSGDIRDITKTNEVGEELVEVDRTRYYTVSDMISLINKATDYEVNYENFKSLSNHRFDVCKVVFKSILTSSDPNATPVREIAEFYYNNTLVYVIEDMLKLYDKDGNLIESNGYDFEEIDNVETMEHETTDEDYVPRK